MKFWQVFLVAVCATILTNAVSGCVKNSIDQYKAFKQYQQTVIQNQQNGGDNNRPFEDGRDNVDDYISTYIPPNATRAEAEEIATAFYNVAGRIDNGILKGREDATADLNREIQAASDRDKWGTFFIGLYPLIDITAQDLRTTGDKIKNAVKKPLLNAVNALREATEQKPTEETPEAESEPETAPEAETPDPEPTPEPEPEKKPETTEATPNQCQNGRCNNNYYYNRPFLPAPFFWSF